MSTITNSQYVFCKCNHCPGQIKFTPEQEGESVECPRCRMQTILYKPAANRPPRVPWYEHWLTKVAVSVTAFGIISFIFVKMGFGGAAFGGASLAIGWLFLILTVVGAVYFLPTIIASRRKHRNELGIMIINAVFGWTLVGWVGALIWAVWEEKK